MTRSKSVGSTPHSPVTESTRHCGDVVQCEGHEHFEMNIVDELVAINVDDIFNHLFTDSPLYAEFIRRRRTFDVKLAPWSADADENGQRTRTIYYTLSINYGFGQKICPSTEIQMLHADSRVGMSYLIDAECVNGGVPYSDHFSTVVRYCIKRVAASVTRLSITGKVQYHKSVWTFIQSIIQKTAASGLSESFGVMVELLQETAAATAAASGHSRHVGLRRYTRPSTLPNSRRSRARLSSATSSSYRYRTNHSLTTPTTQTASDLRAPVLCQSSTPFSLHSTCDNEDGLMRSWLYSDADPAQLFVVLLFIVVLALVVINALLYYQLTALESTVATKLLFDSITVA